MSILMLIIGPLITIYAIFLWVATAQTSLDIAVDMPSMDFEFDAKGTDLTKKRKMPPLVVSHTQHISKRMETKAKMVSSKHISKNKLDRIIHDAYEYE
jgi:hypothetical protein